MLWQLQVSHLFAFSYCSGVLEARILKWFAIPFSSGSCFSELSTMTCPSWVALHGMAHGLIEDNEVVILPTKVHIGKAMVFPVVMYGCENWTIKKAEKWKWSSVVSDYLRPHRLYSPWNSPGQNTGVGSLSLLQGLFQTQGLNPGLLHCRQILYQLSHQGSPRILEWVAYPFSRRIFLTQESNQSLLNCRQILYQLSYDGRKLSTEELMLLNCGVGEYSRVRWTTRRSNQSILKEISPEYSLEGLMLKLKLQYFGQLMWRTD